MTENIQTLCERVHMMETAFDRVHTALLQGDDLSNLQEERQLLESYLSSGQWLKDYEADEQGLIPIDLKRGVLSQDALYDLLEGAES